MNYELFVDKKFVDNQKNPVDFLIREIGSAELTFRKNPQDFLIRKNPQIKKFVLIRLNFILRCYGGR
jgi:hypothetical protein